MSGSPFPLNTVSYILSIAISERDVHSGAALTGLHDTTEQRGWDAELTVDFFVCRRAERDACTSKDGLTVSQPKAGLSRDYKLIHTLGLFSQTM